MASARPPILPTTAVSSSAATAQQPPSSGDKAHTAQQPNGMPRPSASEERAGTREQAEKKSNMSEALIAEILYCTVGAGAKGSDVRWLC